MRGMRTLEYIDPDTGKIKVAHLTQAERLIRLEADLNNIATILRDMKEEQQAIRVKLDDLSRASLLEITKQLKPYILTGLTAYAISKGIPPEALNNIFQ